MSAAVTAVPLEIVTGLNVIGATGFEHFARQPRVQATKRCPDSPLQTCSHLCDCSTVHCAQTAGGAKNASHASKRHEGMITGS